MHAVLNNSKAYNFKPFVYANERVIFYLAYIGPVALLFSLKVG